MKIKTLSYLRLAVSGMVMSIFFNLSSGGVTALANPGCYCHGTKYKYNLTLTGIPAIGFITGRTYASTWRISNFTKTKAGFDLLAGAGTITSASLFKKGRTMSKLKTK